MKKNFIQKIQGLFGSKQSTPLNIHERLLDQLNNPQIINKKAFFTTIERDIIVLKLIADDVSEDFIERTLKYNYVNKYQKENFEKIVGAFLVINKFEGRIKPGALSIMSNNLELNFIDAAKNGEFMNDNHNSDKIRSFLSWWYSEVEKKFKK